MGLLCWCEDSVEREIIFVNKITLFILETQITKKVTAVYPQ
jgi:hypothetical protein